LFFWSINCYYDYVGLLGEGRLRTGEVVNGLLF